MRPLRCLLVISRDFGEYVTAQLFTRGQPFEAYVAVPAALAPFADGPRVGVYGDVAQLDAMAMSLAPDIVILCSGYLFAVNGLISPAALGQWLAALRERGIPVATTDPWLALDTVKPDARFTVYSVSRGGAAPDLSEKMARLHAQLRALLGGLPHVYAVPVPGAQGRVFSFFNPGFATVAPAPARERAQWLFVLSREDYTYLEGFEGEAYRQQLDHHVRRLAAVEGNTVLFIGPAALEGFFAERYAALRNLSYRTFCAASVFERTIRESAIVGYWNMLSSSLLYCMYHRVPPVFFGAGHQIKIREGLHEHAIEHVYGGNAPRSLDWHGSWPEEPRALVESLALRKWLDDIAAWHARSPTPMQLLDTLTAGREAR